MGYQYLQRWFAIRCSCGDKLWCSECVCVWASRGSKANAIVLQIVNASVCVCVGGWVGGGEASRGSKATVTVLETEWRLSLCRRKACVKRSALSPFSFLAIQTIILCVLDRASSWYLNKGWPTRWHLLYYILLNVFQTLIRPSSGASEYLLCCVRWLEACWCYAAGLSVGDVVSECRMNH